MATITHTRGDTLPFVLPLPADATAATLQVHAAGACVEIDGTVNRSRAYFAPTAADDLPPGRVYRTTARTTRADGTTQTIDSFALLILEGCGDASPAPSGIILSGALVEAGADVASGAGALALALSGSLVEAGSDTAAGTGTVTTPTPGSISLSAALIETGADTAAGTASVGITASAALVETGVDTAAGTGTVGTVSVDWLATDGGTFPMYGATAPTGVYDPVGDRTYLTYERWSGVQRVCQVDTYDHATGSWVASDQAGTSILHNDDHGVPAMAIGPNGHIWTFFGPHSNNLRVRVTKNPRDTSAWVALNDIANQRLTYPHPVFVGNDLLIFARREGNPNLAGNRMPLVMFKVTNATGSGAVTWPAPTYLSDFGADSRNYIGCAKLGPDGRIWITNTRANFGDNYRRDVFIFRYDPATGNVENADGSVVAPPASLPIMLDTAEASFRVVTTNATGTGVIPKLEFDTAGGCHLLYGDGPTATEVRAYHSVWDGTTWSAPVEVAYIRNRYSASDLGRLGTGMEFVTTVSPDGSRGGDIHRRTRSAAGVWSDPEVIGAAGPDYRLEVPNQIKDAQADLRFMWAEVSGGGSGSNSSVSGDEFAGFQRVFAWGDGYRTKPFDPKLALSRTSVGAGLVVGDIVAVVTSRQPRETLTLTDPSGSFALSGRNVVVAKALTAGSYPITLRSDFRGMTATITPTITVAADQGVVDNALVRLDFDGTGQTVIDKAGNLTGFLGTSAADTALDPVREATGIYNASPTNTITLPFRPIMNTSANLHVFAAIQLVTNTSGGAIAVRRHALRNEQAFVFDVTNGRLRWIHYNSYNSALTALNPTATLAVNQWALVEAQVNGGGVTLRQDGAVIYEATLSSAMAPNNESDLNIGAFITASGTFTSGLLGRIGAVHIYPRVLTTSDAAEARAAIRNLMAGRGVTLP